MPEMSDEQIRGMLYDIRYMPGAMAEERMNGVMAIIDRLRAEMEELNAELQKRERWMKDNSVWDDYCGGVVPSGPPKPSEGKP